MQTLDCGSRESRYLLLGGIFLFLALVVTNEPSFANDKKESPPAEYQRALQLIHAFSGSGNELETAMRLAEGLSKSHPGGGYAETLIAEALSTWELDQQGNPPELRAQIITLTEQALRLNPGMAQALVARARAFLRASDYERARKSVDTALQLQPNLNGAMFIRAEIFRRTQRLDEAETWYLKFITATPDRPRQSNGYFWLGQAYLEAAERESARRNLLISKARTAYEKMLELDPGGAWKNVNFAIFLNDEIGDFDAAETYAAKALTLMEFPMARYHLAIARYQKILPRMRAIDNRELVQALAEIEQATGISLDQALDFSESYPAIHGRLQKIQMRVRRN